MRKKIFIEKHDTGYLAYGNFAPDIYGEGKNVCAAFNSLIFKVDSLPESPITSEGVITTLLHLYFGFQHQGNFVLEADCFSKHKAIMEKDLENAQTGEFRDYMVINDLHRELKWLTSRRRQVKTLWGSYIATGENFFTPPERPLVCKKPKPSWLWNEIDITKWLEKLKDSKAGKIPQILMGVDATGNDSIDSLSYALMAARKHKPQRVINPWPSHMMFDANLPQELKNYADSAARGKSFMERVEVYSPNQMIMDVGLLPFPLMSALQEKKGRVERLLDTYEILRDPNGKPKALVWGEDVVIYFNKKQGKKLKKFLKSIGQW